MNIKGAKARRPRKKPKKATSQQERHTHSVVAAIEDTTAVTIDLLMEIEAFTTYITGRLRNLLEIQQTSRKGPHAYDKDRPAGLRVTVRRK